MELMIGVSGLLLIVVAWLPESIKSIKANATMDIKFLVPYTIGTLLLAIYSLLLKDPIFTTLNATAFVLSVISLTKKIKEMLMRREFRV